MERVVFSHGAMTPLVAAIEEVAHALGEPPVVVGGIAVLCRAASVDRATVDLDSAHSRVRGAVSALEMIRRHPGAKAVGPVGTELETEFGPAHVDVIEVLATEEARQLNVVDDRLHAMSHQWAISTATSVEMVVMDGAKEVIAVESQVATAGPLVAMKLQSVQDRGGAKEGTDLLDIVRLTLDPSAGPTVVQQLRTVEDVVATDCAEFVGRVLLAHPARALRRIHDAGGRDITADTLGDVAAILLAACQR